MAIIAGRPGTGPCRQGDVNPHLLETDVAATFMLRRDASRNLRPHDGRKKSPGLSFLESPA